MIIELANLPLAMQLTIQNGEQIQIMDKGQEVAIITQSAIASHKIRQPNLLTALTGKTIEADDSVWFEPMSEEELAWWNGDKTDKYGISL